MTAATDLAQKIRDGGWRFVMQIAEADGLLWVHRSIADPRVTMEQRLATGANQTVRRFVFAIPGSLEVAERGAPEGDAREIAALEALAAWIVEEDRAAERLPPS